MKKTICELFAGVGGFRVGFDRLDSGWETTWFSQWEPGAKTQWAHDCYVKHFGDLPDTKGEYHTGEDIGEMEKCNIPFGSAVNLGGWDGEVDATQQTEYIPQGKSLFEFGTNKKVQPKAEADYSKRSSDSSIWSVRG